MAEGFISDETLMGYLLDALTDSENSSVEDALATNHHLRVRLQVLREMLFPLAEDNDVFEPPLGLSDRVIEAIDSHSSLDSICNDAPISSQYSAWATSSSPLSSGSHVTPVGALERAKEESPARSWADLFVGLTAVIVGLCILSPALLRSQEGARAAQCSGKLRELGEMIRDYAFYRPEHAVPEVEAEGPLAFAGVYAMRLSDAGLLEDRSMLWCPDSQVISQAALALTSGTAPTIPELVEMASTRREIWHNIAGGSFAYNLGVMVDNEHTTPRMQGRSRFAILADAPLRESADQKTWTVHLGAANNVLFEDGHIELVRFDKPLDLLDHPFWNHDGKNQAGIDINDSVLGRSNRNPFGLKD